MHSDSDSESLANVKKKMKNKPTETGSRFQNKPPKTPKSVNQPASSSHARTSIDKEEAVGSTPFGGRLGGQSGFMPDLTVPNVSPAIRNDIKDHIQTRITKMLLYLLRRASLPERRPGADLDEHLAATDAVAQEIQDMDEWKEYRKKSEAQQKGKEPELYPLFTAFANKALKLLRTSEALEEFGLLPSVDGMLFHVSDTQTISTPHGQESAKTFRRPDVVGLSAENAIRAGQHKDEAAALEASGKPPQNAFDWDIVTYAVEFKNFDDHVKLKPVEQEEDRMRDLHECPGYEVPEDIYQSDTSTLVDSSLGDGSPPPINAREGRLRSQHRASSAQTGNTNSTGSKRRREDADAAGSESKQRKVARNAGVSSRIGSEVETRRVLRPRSSTKKPDPTIQLALYGAEILSAPFRFSNHAIAVLISGSIIHVWWYDREGAIQTTGFDFLLDPKHFVLLLLALDRLPRCTIPGLRRENVEGGNPKTFLEVQGTEFEVGDRISGRYGIVSRGTEVYGVTKVEPSSLSAANTSPATQAPPTTPRRPTRKGKDPISPPKEPATTGLVMKVAHIQKSRIREEEMIAIAYYLARNYTGKDATKIKKAILGHLPEIVAAQDFDDYEDTQNIRDGLSSDGDEEKKKNSSRVLRVVVMKRLRSILEAPAEKVREIFEDCMNCHWALWKLGLHHRDISVNNLMYYVDEAGQYWGVLNDFDLASLKNRKATSALERTGTLPFMAIDLLEPRAMRGDVTHLYRHDHESFLWVLMWIAHPHMIKNDDPDEAPGAKLYPFEEWAQTHARCSKEKWAILGKKHVNCRSKRVEPRWEHEDWWISLGLHWLILTDNNVRRRANEAELARAQARELAEEVDRYEEEFGKYLQLSDMTLETWEPREAPHDDDPNKWEKGWSERDELLASALPLLSQTL